MSPAPTAAPAAVKSDYRPDELWTTVSGMTHMDIMETRAPAHPPIAEVERLARSHVAADAGASSEKVP